MSYFSYRYENDGGMFEFGQLENDIDRIFYSYGFSTRRRKCVNLVFELIKGWKEMEQDEFKWRSDSIDIEDSGYGGEIDERSEQDGEQVVIVRIKRFLFFQ